MGHEFLISAGLVLVLDFLTKAIVTRRLGEGQSVRLGRWLRLRHLANPNRIGLLQNSPIASILVFGIALFILTYETKQGYFFQRPAAQGGLGAAIGGAASNLYDRIRQGAVIDFIDVGWWPVFNIADIGISVGAITALCFMR